MATAKKKIEKVELNLGAFDQHYSMLDWSTAKKWNAGQWRKAIESTPYISQKIYLAVLQCGITGMSLKELVASEYWVKTIFSHIWERDLPAEKKAKMKPAEIEMLEIEIALRIGNNSRVQLCQILKNPKVYGFFAVENDIVTILHGVKLSELRNFMHINKYGTTSCRMPKVNHRIFTSAREASKAMNPEMVYKMHHALERKPEFLERLMHGTVDSTTIGRSDTVGRV